MKNFLLDMASLIYPSVCAGCGQSLYRHEEIICNKCFVSLPKTNFFAQKENPVYNTFVGRVNLSNAHSFLLFHKKGMVQKMLHQLKYKGKPEVGQLLGKWYGQDLVKAATFLKYDVIIPVPLHKKRLQKRGYNQSEAFAKGLSETLKLPVFTDVLLKTTYTETQTHKTREERVQNTLQSFSIQNIEKIKSKHVLLVDDVITTGATTEACILQLQRAHPSSISVATIAYTV